MQNSHLGVEVARMYTHSARSLCERPTFSKYRYIICTLQVACIVINDAMRASHFHHITQRKCADSVDPEVYNLTVQVWRGRFCRACSRSPWIVIESFCRQRWKSGTISAIGAVHDNWCLSMAWRKGQANYQFIAQMKGREIRYYALVSLP